MSNYQLAALSIFVSLTCAPFLASCSDGGFSDEDLKQMKKSIETEFSKREGVTVVKVEMMRETPKKAIGLVQLRIPVFGELTKSCTATMAEGRQYIWQCQ